MRYESVSPDTYMNEIPEERRDAIGKLREIIKTNLPEGFEETMGYGMIGYVVPHQLYPAGYHCNPKEPLPFMGLASQKNFIAVYHMGLYSDPSLLTWFLEEYPKHTSAKPDVGKSCLRFKKPEQIPYQLIGELCTKITVEQWIKIFESRK